MKAQQTTTSGPTATSQEGGLSGVRDDRFGSPSSASLSILRILFGATMCLGTLRFMASGWIETVFVEPSYFFKYPGFSWVFVPSPAGLYALYSALALLAACVAIGLFYRVSLALFVLGFAYVQLMDLTNYLNHYYLVLLVGTLMLFMPAHARYSVDAWRKPALYRATIPAWSLWLLRLQIAIVYFNAGLAKATSDWLLHGQPLGIWLSARTETPILGQFFAMSWAPLAMSWAGFLFDLTIWLWLLIKPTRRFAYATVLVFHGLTAVLFDIGMFPILMPVMTTIFFRPDWPEIALSRFGFRRAAGSTPETILAQRLPRYLSKRWALAIAIYVAVQLVLPLRSLLYPGSVLWHEQGMRYAWKVMVREKNGSVTYHVRRPSDGRSWQVSPHRYLTWRQANEMSSQPDMIQQLGRHIAADFERRGLGRVEVRVEAWVSLNGRVAQLMIDPTVDLARTAGSSMRPAPWILPGPKGAPPAFRHTTLAGGVR